MKNALDCFWPLLELVEPVMAIWSQWAWPSGVWEQLIEADFLCRTVNAETVLCPGCYQHDEEVIALDRPGGGVDLFVPCPASLRAQVDPEWLHQWTGNFTRIVTQLAEALGLSRRVGRREHGSLAHDQAVAPLRRGCASDSHVGTRCVVA